MKRIVLAAVAFVAAAPATAAPLLFTITNGTALVESFTLDDEAGLESTSEGYLSFRITGSTLGNNGAYFGDASTFNNFGTGQVRPNFLVAPRFDDEAPGTTLYNDTGTMLEIAAGSTFATAAGYSVAVTSAATTARPGALLFTVTDNGSLVQTFTLDSGEGLESPFEGYLAFRLLDSSAGDDGAYFGDLVNSSNFGTGRVQPNFSVAPTYDDEAATLLYSGTGTRLGIGAGSSFLTASGYTVTVTASQVVTPSVPEPATWGLMLTGFGLVGAGLRTRRRSVTCAAA